MMTKQLFVFKLLINYTPLDFHLSRFQIPLSKEYLTFKFQSLYLLISCIYHTLENSNRATSILFLLPDFNEF